MKSIFAFLLPIVLMSGCNTVGYYGQLAKGQWDILCKREPIAAIVTDPSRPPDLRRRLETARQARNFAVVRLHLPNNRSYRLYSDTGRHYVVWNVFATPEFSLTPLQHCFPIAGCVAYRGYYNQEAAEQQMRHLQKQGYDVWVDGIPSYSTLGWFDDPILNTMLPYGDDWLIGNIFHELAHQKLYVADDTAFNESFASFVEQEGLRLWRQHRGMPPQDLQSQQRQNQFNALMSDTRIQLQKLYARKLPPIPMREEKQAIFKRLQQKYRALRNGEWQGDSRYDRWLQEPLNNARFLPFELYEQQIPAFHALYLGTEGDWPAFYRQVATLSALPYEQRKLYMQLLKTRPQKALSRLRRLSCSRER